MIFRSPVSSSFVRISHSSKLLAVFHIAGETFGDTSADSVLLTPDGTRAGELHLWAVFDLD